MAKDEIIIKLRVEDGDLKISTQNIDKHSKAIDKQTKTKRRGTKASNRFNKAEKGLYQTNLAGAKGFSKMNQTMGGSSGLVAAYATLAANVFAATAAFGALQRAAQFEQLKKGLTELGQQSGRTLSIMARGLRDVTGGAISMEEAMRAAALGVSGGFGGEQLEKLAKIARGASITLGRSLPDAFDRLTRGAIKLEPEILDELGIMVRLDDAVENYGAQIGKAGNALTQMERRQAFMNAIIEQGTSKFGEIADAVEPDAYSRLGATFSDLTNTIFNFFNVLANPIVSILADNVLMLGGVMLLFGSTIAGKMIPALAGGAAAAADHADKLVHLAHTAREAASAQEAFLISGLGKGKDTTKFYNDLVKGLSDSKTKTKDLAKLNKSLNEKIRLQKIEVRSLSGVEKKRAVARLTGLQAEKIQLTQLTQLELGKGAAALASANAITLSNAQLKISEVLIARTNKEIGFGAAWKKMSKLMNNYSAELVLNAKAASKNGETITALQMRKIKFTVIVKKAKLAVRLLSNEFLFLLGPIAAALILVGAFIAIWRWKNNTKEQKKYNKGVEDLNKLIEELPVKVEKYHKALENTKNVADGQLRSFEIQSGLLTEMNDKLRTQVRLREEADDAGGRKERLGKGKFRQWAETFGIGDVEGMTGDSLVKQFGFDDSFFDGLDDAGKAVRNVLSVEWSDELKVAAAILKEGIPDQSELLSKKLKEVFTLGGTPEEIVAGVHKAIGEVTAAFGNLGPAAKGLREGLKEAEKEGSKFLATFAKKTGVDMFAKALTTIVKSMNELEKSAEEAGKTTENVLGKALLDVGARVASMIGPDFVQAQKNLRDATTALDKGIDAGVKGPKKLALEQAVMSAAVALGLYKEDVVALNKDILKTQRLEITRKTILEGINKVMKFAGKNYKTNRKLAGLENKMLLRKLKFEKQITDAKIKQVKTLFKVIKVTEYDKDNKAQVREIEFSKFITMNLEEQQQIIEKTSLTHEHLSSLLESELKTKLQTLAIDKERETLVLNTQKQEMEYLKAQLVFHKKLRDLEQDSFKLAAQKEAFLRRGTITLNASEEATIKISAAEAAARLAERSMAAELKLIEIKGKMQLIDIRFLNSEIALYNKKAMKEEGLTKAQLIAKEEWIDAIDFDEAENAINRSVELQQDIIKENVKNLQAQVTIALLGGLEAFRKDLKDKKINLGAALTGQEGLLKKLTGGGPDALSNEDMRLRRESSGWIEKIARKFLNNFGSDFKVHSATGDAATLSVADQIKDLESQRLDVDKKRLRYGEEGKEDQRRVQFNEDLDSKIEKLIEAENNAAIVTATAVKEATESAENALAEESSERNKAYADSWKLVNGVYVQKVVPAIEAIAPAIIEGLGTVTTNGHGSGTGDTEDGGTEDGGTEGILSYAEILANVKAEHEATKAAAAALDATNAALERDIQRQELIDSIMYSGGPEPFVPEGGFTIPEGELDTGTLDEKGNLVFMDDVTAKAARYFTALEQMRTTTEEFSKVVKEFGPEGEAYAAFMGGIFGENGVISAIDGLVNNSGNAIEALGNMGDIIGSIGTLMAASSDMAIAQIDNQIKAEKARDGSSEKSVAKIKSLEAKKIALQKKAFETKKKIGIAETIIATAQSAMQAFKTFSEFPPLAVAMAAMVIAFGMKQVSLIRNQQFTGGAGQDSVTPASIAVGERTNRVDVSKQASAGELAYLRGQRGIGTTATNFKPLGGAAGMRKGYADGGSILVGERGPETITPLTGLNVVPAGQGAKSQINAHFTIHAIDAAGVEEVLLGQQGNIISMIRSAANDYGEDFLEVIDTESYGDFSSGGGVDY